MNLPKIVESTAPVGGYSLPSRIQSYAQTKRIIFLDFSSFLPGEWGRIELS